MAAEACALVDALDCSYFVTNFFSQILFSDNLYSNLVAIVGYTDNESLYKNIHSTTMADEFRLRIDLGMIKEMLEKRELLQLNWVPSHKQLADCLTKKVGNALPLCQVLENGCFK